MPRLHDETAPMARRFAVVVAILAASATALGQSVTPQAPPAVATPAQSAPPIVVRTPVVIVPVTVKDAKGQLVGDLPQGEFRILADNVEQKIATFSSDPVPLSAVILLDNDLDQRVVSRVQRSLIAISAGFASSDEVAIVAYDDLQQTVSDFSHDNDALYTILTRFEVGSHNRTIYTDPAMPTGAPTSGTTPPPWSEPPPGAVPVNPNGGTRLVLPQRFKTTVALNDAVFTASQMLRDRGRDRRKIIFLVSDDSDSGNNTHGFDETLRSLLVSDVSVFSISVSHSVPIGKKLLQKGALEVQKYATQTGGDTYYAGNQIDLERLYSALTEQARNQYTLTFSLREVAKGQDFHPIEVRVERPGLSVETREGYYESAIAPGR